MGDRDQKKIVATRVKKIASPKWEIGNKKNRGDANQKNRVAVQKVISFFTPKWSKNKKTRGKNPPVGLEP